MKTSIEKLNKALAYKLEGLYDAEKKLLEGHTVKDVLMREIPMIDDQATIKDAASMLLNSQNKNFLVTNEGIPVGTISRNEIIEALRKHGEETTVHESKNREIMYLPMDTPLELAWKEMQQANKSMILIKAEDQLRGAVDDESIAELLLIEAAKNCSLESLGT